MPIIYLELLSIFDGSWAISLYRVGGRDFGVRGSSFDCRQRLNRRGADGGSGYRISTKAHGYSAKYVLATTRHPACDLGGVEGGEHVSAVDSIMLMSLDVLSMFFAVVGTATGPDGRYR
ncbi:hypothetical protein ACHMZP_32850 [Rhodococcus baikonurensis]|uniref:hypothetical protein n=1 Tax=Rhodococcus baikonurensis TaxID=172041 RepID=UPI0037B103FA